LELKDYYTKTCYQPGAVAHAYNPSYLGGRDQEVHVLRPAQAKSPRDLIATNKKKKKLSMMAHTCHPSCMENINRRMPFKA
jgi:hypothetical protein